MKVVSFVWINILKVYIMLIHFMLNNFVLGDRARAKMMGWLHPRINIAENVKLRKNVTLYSGGHITGKLTVGIGSFINEEVLLDFSGEIVIGQDVGLAMRVLVISSTHKIGDPKRAGTPRKKKTVLEDNVWIGAGAIIYPGITVGKGAVVAAGEIVSKDIPSNKLLKDGQLQDIAIKEGE